MLVPLNLPLPMPEEFALPSPVVWRELTILLAERAEVVETLPPERSRDLWLASIRAAREQAGERAGFDDAAGNLARSLATSSTFDRLLIPSLMLRPAPVAGRIAKWDGVTRDVEFNALGMAARSHVRSTPFEGQIPAASLHVGVFDRSGAKLCEGLMGLELLARVRVENTEQGPRVSLERRPGFLADRVELRRSVETALRPCLDESVEAARGVESARIAQAPRADSRR